MIPLLSRLLAQFGWCWVEAEARPCIRHELRREVNIFSRRMTFVKKQKKLNLIILEKAKKTKNNISSFLSK